MARRNHLLVAIPLAAGLALFLGCAGTTEGGAETAFILAKPKEKSIARVEMTAEEKQAKEQRERNIAGRMSALEGSIGALVTVEARPPLVVEGYGVVSGLAGTGSSQAPQRVLDELAKSISRNRDLADDVTGRSVLDAKAFLRSKNNAVVIVRGVIPSGAMPGDSFDVEVASLPSSDTSSLEGGRLFTTDLTLRAADGAAGNALATAAGPMFVSPFLRPEREAQKGGFAKPIPQLRKGVVIGGGKVIKGRPVRLVLKNASYYMAATIRDRVNAHFGGNVADATSPSYVELLIPKAWRSQRDRFIGVATHLMLRTEAGHLERKARELVESIQDPDAPLADISLMWEGLGRPVWPIIQPLYAHPSRKVSFFAARAGLRTGDPAALPVVVGHLRDEGGELRDLACQELANVDPSLRRPAASALAELLASDNLRLRLKAYEALIRLPAATPLLNSVRVDGGEFWIDVITLPKGAKPMVYAWRSQEQRIALFGDDLSLRTPILYVSPDESFTLEQRQAKLSVNVLRRVRGSLVSVPDRDADLMGLIRFLGSKADPVDPDLPAGPTNLSGVRVSYSQILSALMELCAKGEVQARFVMQAPQLTDFVGEGVRGPRPIRDDDLPEALDPSSPPEADPASGPEPAPTPSEP